MHKNAILPLQFSGPDVLSLVQLSGIRCFDVINGHDHRLDADLIVFIFDFCAFALRFLSSQGGRSASGVGRSR